MNKKEFIKHEQMCPFCKNEQSKTRITKYQDGKTYHMLECSCGGVWEPRKATKENLERFRCWYENIKIYE